MAVALADIPVDEISQRAREIRPGRTALLLAAAPLFLLGFVLAKTFTVGWRSGRWVAAAFMVGWARAAGPSRSAQIIQLKATIKAQEIQLSRFSG